VKLIKKSDAANPITLQSYSTKSL